MYVRYGGVVEGVLRKSRKIPPPYYAVLPLIMQASSVKLLVIRFVRSEIPPPNPLVDVLFTTLTAVNFVSPLKFTMLIAPPSEYAVFRAKVEWYIVPFELKITIAPPRHNSFEQIMSVKYDSSMSNEEELFIINALYIEFISVVTLLVLNNREVVSSFVLGK